MLKTENGSIDGVRVSSYQQGKEYDLTASAGARDLARAFVGARMAVEIPPDPVQQAQTEPASAGFFTPEEKSEPAAQENKAVQPSENKKPGKRKDGGR